jgi:hypothetical protein
MTPDSAMVLTGKQSLDYSAGLSRGQLRHRRLRLDHGPERAGPVLGTDLSKALDVLPAHCTHTYTARANGSSRPAASTDPTDRDIRSAPHRTGRDFTRLGEIFDPATNGDRKNPSTSAQCLRCRRRRPPPAGALGRHA